MQPPTAQSPRQALQQAVAEAFAEVSGFDDVDPQVTACHNNTMGDLQANAAMSVAGRIKKERGEKANPRQIAEQVVAKLGDLPMLASAPEVAGPGFINFRLAPDWVAEQATLSLASQRLGIATDGDPQRVVVEYSSPNIAKQMHVGHIRTTVIGDALARVFTFLGQDVVRQNHTGDWGTQFGMLIERLREAGGVDEADIGDLEGFYRQAKQRFDSDEDFKARARDTVVALQRGDEKERVAWQRFVDETRKHTQQVYETLGVLLTVDDERGESSYNDRLPGLTQELLDTGVAEVSDGAVVSFTDGFKAPLMIRKSNGGFCYGTTDLAAAEYRAKHLKADRVIYVVGAEQQQHFKQLFATYDKAVEQAGWPGGVTFEHAVFGNVLGHDGRKISTKNLDKSLPPDAGPEVLQLLNLLDIAVQKARSVVDEMSRDLPDDSKADLARAIGIGAVKYADLSKDRSSDYVFSFDEMLRLDGNSGPYMQYAHARVRSVLDKAAQAGVTSDGRITTLEAEEELALAKALIEFGDVVRQVAADLRPHVLCTYLYDLARAFSRFYDACPILKSEGEQRQSRLALADLAGRTIAQGLDLLGIEHPNRM